LLFSHKIESGEVADDYLKWFTTIFSAVSKVFECAGGGATGKASPLSEIILVLVRSCPIGGF